MKSHDRKKGTGKTTSGHSTNPFVFLPRNTKQKIIHWSPEFPYESGTGVQ